ncbi:MAG: hypothetical protein R2882_06285 [Gemmatimonadales bacterium]
MAAGSAMVAGRGFDGRDQPESARVAILNRQAVWRSSAARIHWAAACHPLGDSADTDEEVEVVEVVEDVVQARIE